MRGSNSIYVLYLEPTLESFQFPSIIYYVSIWLIWEMMRRLLNWRVRSKKSHLNNSFSVPVQSCATNNRNNPPHFQFSIKTTNKFLCCKRRGRKVVKRRANPFERERERESESKAKVAIAARLDRSILLFRCLAVGGSVMQMDERRCRTSPSDTRASRRRAAWTLPVKSGCADVLQDSATQRANVPLNTSSSLRRSSHADYLGDRLAWNSID